MEGKIYAERGKVFMNFYACFWWFELMLPHFACIKFQIYFLLHHISRHLFIDWSLSHPQVRWICNIFAFLPIFLFPDLLVLFDVLCALWLLGSNSVDLGLWPNYRFSILWFYLNFKFAFQINSFGAKNYSLQTQKIIFFSVPVSNRNYSINLSLLKH